MFYTRDLEVEESMPVISRTVLNSLKYFHIKCHIQIEFGSL